MIGWARLLVKSLLEVVVENVHAQGQTKNVLVSLGAV